MKKLTKEELKKRVKFHDNKAAYYESKLESYNKQSKIGFTLTSIK